jgi:hypothetical protein
MILIVAFADDVTIDRVTPKLDLLHADYVRFDPKDFPMDATFSWGYDRSGAMRRLLRGKHGEIDLDNVDTVWCRARIRFQPLNDSVVAEERKGWVDEGGARMLSDFWECLDCFRVPIRPSSDPAPSADNKFHQLAVASRLGFALPRTLVTNNPEDFLRFYEECGGCLISKSPLKMPATQGGEQVASHTHALQRRRAAACQGVRHAPVVFQENLPKRLELRVTVVGRAVFAAAIQSQPGHLMSTDWRHYPHVSRSQCNSVYRLPPEVEARCADLVAELGLCYGAIDLVLTPDGEYVFLEVTPNGEWGFVEAWTDLPIYGAIADTRVRGAA